MQDTSLLDKAKSTPAAQVTRGVTTQDLSLCNIIVGVRGGGKTLLMSHFICDALTRSYMVDKAVGYGGDEAAYKYRKRKHNIWSNYPVAFWWQPPIEGWKPVGFQSRPLDIEALLVWDKQFEDGIIFFDEIDQIADRQDWQSALSKMLTAGAQVIRHRNLTLVLTIQSMNWLNARLQWQADIVAKCRDLCFTDWGREQGLQPGEVIRTIFISKSGVNTGYTYEETGAQYKWNFYGKRYWHVYKTRHEFDVALLKTKYELKFDRVTVDLRGKDEERQRSYDVMHEVMEELALTGKYKIMSRDFMEMCDHRGMDMSHTSAGQYLREIGVKSTIKHGYPQYDIKDLVVET